MQKEAVNPWPWSLQYGYNQGEIIEAPKRLLVCAGQTAVDAQGAPQHAGDMRSQMTLALDNLEAVLKAAGMKLPNIIQLKIFTLDADETLKNFDVLGSRMGPAGANPPMTLLGVSRLAIPELLFEIEAIAAD